MHQVVYASFGFGVLMGQERHELGQVDIPTFIEVVRLHDVFDPIGRNLGQGLGLTLRHV